MEKNIEKIYLDIEGLNEFKKEIEKLEKELTNINKGRREAFDAGAGDGWDSPEFEELERAERRILGELKRKKIQLENIVIIEKHSEENKIDIGDVIRINMIFDIDDIEEMVIKLVTSVGNINSEIQEVSINSPLGKSVYKKNVGEKSSYAVNGNIINIDILEKVNSEKIIKR